MSGTDTFASAVTAGLRADMRAIRAQIRELTARIERLEKIARRNNREAEEKR